MASVQPALVVGAVRTPTGKKGGGLSKVHPAILGKIVTEEVVKRAGVKASDIDESIIGCATQTAQQGLNVGRIAVYLALGPDAPASTVNMLCGSSAQAIRFAAAQVSSGENDIVIAGGTENNLMVFQGQDLMPCTQVSGGGVKALWQLLSGDLKGIFRKIMEGTKIVNRSLPKDYLLHPMGKSGDAIAKEYGFPRRLLDEVAFWSHMHAADATYEGHFKDEIVPVQTPGGIIEADEGIRANTSLDALAKLKPSFGRDGLHTAGTSSQISAGAAALMIANEDAVKKYNLKPIARIVASAVVGTDPSLPEKQLIGPIDAIKKVLAKAKLNIDDIDLFELNEAFASVLLATQKELKIPAEKLNISGGAIALGHALGTSGARLPVTLLHNMQRRAQEGLPAKRGMSALCIGGGQAIATIYELV